MSGFHVADAGRDVARYLGLTMRETGPVRPGGAELLGSVDLLDHLCGPDGSVRTGALLALADSVGGLTGGLASLPGWIVSTNLMLRTTPTPVDAPLLLETRVIRAGKAAVVTEITVTDARRRPAPVATATLTSAILEPENGPPHWDRPLLLEATAPHGADPLDAFVGIRPVDDRTLRMDLREDLRNPWGILHGGISAALVDLAAVHVAGTATTDVVMHFLRPGRVGPIAAVATPIGARADGTLVRIELRDEGAHGRVMVIAVATVR
jgi:uncharacterized protein (TIGR00369 family)